MNDSEQIAEKYLLTLGLGSVVFEPDGNVTPDFSLNDNIGIEVRRLNQNFQQVDGSTEGLEKIAFSLTGRMKTLLATLGPSDNGESWYVDIGFSRPLGDLKLLLATIKSKLLAFKQSATRSRRCINITSNFALEFVRASKDHGTFFLLGIVGDDDSGGWVTNEMVKNVRLCILKKEKTVLAYRAKYSEWWLFLDDQISFGAEPDDPELFRREVMLNIHHTFDRIVLLDPTDHNRSFEVYSCQTLSLHTPKPCIGS